MTSDLRTNTIFVVTAVYISEDRKFHPDDHRPWTWTATLERAIATIDKGPDFWMESGSYTHVVVEEFKEFHIMEESAHWYRVRYHPETGDYDKAEPCENPRPNSCSWGMG